MKRLLLLLCFAGAAAAQPTIAPAVFGGSGLNDGTSGGRTTSITQNTTLTVTISATGASDAISATKTDSGGTATLFTSNLIVAGVALPIYGGVTITFSAATGHTAGDTWNIAVRARGTTQAETYRGSGIGAVTRAADAKAGDIVSVMDYGATGNGVTDDTVAIQNAFNNAPVGSALYFPGGTYLVSAVGGGPNALTLTRPVSLSGLATLNFVLPAPLSATVTACSESALGVVTITAANSFVSGWHGQFYSGFTTNCTFLNGAVFDVISATPSQFTFQFQGISIARGGADSGTVKAGMGLIHAQPQCTLSSCVKDWFDWKIEDLTFTGPDNFINAMEGIVMDCPTSNYAIFGKSTIRNISTDGMAGGYAIYMPNLVNAEGCFMISDITDNYFGNGVYIYGGGDTVHIQGGRINSAIGDGINLWSWAGAVDNTISHINIITGGSPIHIRRAQELNLEKLELGVHNFSGRPVPYMPAVASIWLDGNSAQDSAGTMATDGVHIADSFMGVDENDSLALPNLQIDTGVTNTVIGRNNWHPPSISGTPTAAVINNGYDTVLDDGQLTIRLTQGGGVPIRFLSGSGSLGKENFPSLNGLGTFYENRLLYSEDGTQYPWQTFTAGGGTAAISHYSNVLLPDGTTGSATRVILTITTGTAQLIQAISGLSNPHSGVAQAWIRKTACGGSAETMLFGSTGSIGLATADCSGDANGWRPIKSVIASEVASTTDYVLLGINPNIQVSTSVDVLITFMQFSSNFSRYVKTTNAAVLPSYGTDETKPVSLPLTPFGYQDTSSTAPPTCNALARGLTFDSKVAGTDLHQQCQMVSASPVVYAWVPFFMLTPSTENYLLQSNTWNDSPWQLQSIYGASAPVVTTANSVPDPFGNTGTVQQVVLSLNGSTTLQSTSQANETVTKPGGTGQTSTVSIWVKAASGSPLFFFGNGSAYNCINTPYYASSTTWQQFTSSCADGATTDQLQLGITYIGSPNPYPNSETLYVFGACMTYYNGTCTTTSGAPIITATTPTLTSATASVPGSLRAGVGGSATALACWMADGKTLGHATMNGGNISACSNP